jgi:hypothetical protein
VRNREKVKKISAVSLSLRPLDNHDSGGVITRGCHLVPASAAPAHLLLSSAGLSSAPTLDHCLLLDLSTHLSLLFYRRVGNVETR